MNRQSEILERGGPKRRKLWHKQAFGESPYYFFLGGTASCDHGVSGH